MAQSIYGDGMENVERTEDFLILRSSKEIDVFVFPEIGYFVATKAPAVTR